MANTYTYITKVQPSGVTSFSITGIPSTYSDLMVHYSIRTNDNANTNQRITLRINSNSSNIYLWNQTPSGYQPSMTSGLLAEISVTASYLNTQFGSGIITIPNYANTSIPKSLVWQTGAMASANTEAMFLGGFINSTAAISELNFICNTYNSQTIVGGSTVWLYGLKRN